MYSSGGGGGYYGGGAYDRQYSGRYPSSGNVGAQDDSSAIGKIKEEYWLTKQKIIKKFNRKEDTHVVAGDADLDSKLEVFHSIQQTTLDLLRILEKYQDRICGLSGEENAMGRFLKTHSQTDKSRAGKMMAAVGKVQSYSAQQRLGIRTPLQRLQQEVETFRQRAIADCAVTLQRMEKARTEYRAALLWMKDISENLDPDTHKQLEKFRTVQGQVRRTKTRFDKLKVDCIQKIDLLAASRCNMFSNVLTSYQSCLITFLEKSSRALSAVSQTFYGYQPYEFSVIKELADPAKKELQEEEKAAEEEEQSSSSQDLDEVDRLIKEIQEIGKGCRSNFRVGPKFEDPSCPISDDQNVENSTHIPSGLISIDDGPKDVAPENGLLISDDIKRSDSLENLFADLSSDVPPSAELASLQLDSNPNALQSIDADGNPNADPLLSEDADNLTLLNEIMGAGTQNPESDSNLETLLGIQHNPGTLGAQQQYGANSQMALQQQQQFGAPGSAFHSFNQQWNAHFGIGAAVDPMQQQWQLQQQQQQQMFMQQMQHPTGPQNMALANIKAPPSYNAVTSNENAPDQIPTDGPPKKDLSAWYGMFAELDPLANPDAIGKTGNDEDDRNC